MYMYTELHVGKIDDTFGHYASQGHPFSQPVSSNRGFPLCRQRIVMPLHQRCDFVWCGTHGGIVELLDEGGSFIRIFSVNFTDGDFYRLNSYSV